MEGPARRSVLLALRPAHAQVLIEHSGPRLVRLFGWSDGLFAPLNCLGFVTYARSMSIQYQDESPEQP